MVIFLDGTEPLSCIGGIDDLRDVDSDEDINATHETGTLLLLQSNILCESYLCYFLTVVIRHRPSMR